MAIIGDSPAQPNAQRPVMFREAIAILSMLTAGLFRGRAPFHSLPFLLSIYLFFQRNAQSTLSLRASRVAARRSTSGPQQSHHSVWRTLPLKNLPSVFHRST